MLDLNNFDKKKFVKDAAKDHAKKVFVGIAFVVGCGLLVLLHDKTGFGGDSGLFESLREFVSDVIKTFFHTG